jgi:ABC-type multidrug transport system fused ATPase/permease subunit
MKQHRMLIKKTDEIIQTTIANHFQDRTVLTIAHRLNTVAKSDRILVLDKGIIMNFDTPMNILPDYQ